MRHIETLVSLHKLSGTWYHAPGVVEPPANGQRLPLRDVHIFTCSSVVHATRCSKNAKGSLSIDIQHAGDAMSETQGIVFTISP